MINLVEQRMVERLHQGVGDIIAYVGSYGGELDDKAWETVRQLPAVWVTYGGANRIESGNTARNRYRENHTFITMIAVRSVRSEVDGRQGGPHHYEIGSYDLIKCVKYLLTNQTLDQLVHRGLTPRRIRTLHNNQMIGQEALSVFAIEWEALLDDSNMLEDGRFPEITDDQDHQDYWFNQYRRVSRDKPYDNLLRIHGKIANTDNSGESSVDFITDGHHAPNLKKED